MKTNRNISLWQEKAPIYRLSCSKAPKTQQICHYRHMKKNNELFLLFNTGVDFSLHNNFANSGSFAKISVPVHIIIPCIYQGIIDIIPCIYTLSIWSCLLLQHHTHRRTQLPLSMHYTVAYTSRLIANLYTRYIQVHSIY